MTEEIERLAAPRCLLGPFAACPSTFDELRIEPAGEFAGAELPIDGLESRLGSYRVEGDRILVRIIDDPLAAEAALRILWHVAIARQGGVLVHASGVLFGEEGVVALGPSGAGKSTFAALCTAAGGRLMSDEIIALYPDGSAHGTPFRSDNPAPGCPDRVRLRSLFLLEKGGEERLSPVEPSEAIAALLSQCFRSNDGELSGAETMKRLAPLIDDPGVHRLRFRKHLDAGRFVKEWLGAPLRR